MKSNCAAKRGRLCYFDEICKLGKLVGVQQAKTDMWVPITESRTNKNPNWVQVGTSGIPVCDKHTKYAPVNTPGSWMATKKVVPYKKLYPCCPKGEKIYYYLHNRFDASRR